MSNQLVSQQFQVPEGQMVHMDHVPETVDLSAGDMQKNLVGHVSSSPMPLHFTVSHEQLGSVEQSPKDSMLQNCMVSNNHIGQIEPKGRTLGFGASKVMLSNLGSQMAFLPSKRKAEMEEAKANSGNHNMVMPNKRTMQIGIPPQLFQPPYPNKKSTEMQSKVATSVKQISPATNRKVARNESTSNRTASQEVLTPKNQTKQNEPFSKVHTESSGAVRSKMREQLAAALSLASRNTEKNPTAEKNHIDASVNQETGTNFQPNGTELIASGAAQHNHQASRGSFASRECVMLDKYDDTHGIPAKLPNSECMGNHTFLPDDDVSFSDNFFVKDELLQGNGLSWAVELDMQAIEESGKPCTNEANDLHAAGGATASVPVKSPEELASDIEAELFKLFSGVNKKYKEKGRSLVFNLKDRNNPDLREKVMSGEITPERLCSMTAEELASKELSEWRMAKAEELAQMVVLPETDFGKRRLVKKTHKGEYQVEVEDDGIAVEVSGGSSSPPRDPPKSMETRSPEFNDTNDKENTGSHKNASENQDPSDSFVIPSDGSDLMQGMMVDELKDVELPPIISLDEFMECLHSEPPQFGSVQAEAGQSTPGSDKGNTKVDTDVAASNLKSKGHGESREKADVVVMKDAVVETAKSKESPVVQNITLPATTVPKVEHAWEGAVQLSTSSSVKTSAVFISGDKTSVAEWPSSLEIKGRVRLDAFEKFIKDLPMSRTRAVMVMHFLLKDNSAESERANLTEAIESYISDDRLGFAEPASGVELYLCPGRGRVVDMLSHYLSKDRTDIFNSSDNGLIGVIVWRKVQISSTLSPNSSSSHQKHASSKRSSHFTTRKPQEKDSNVNVNVVNKATTPTSNSRPPSHVGTVIPPPSDEDDSDIPPGFGPPAGGGRDDDDLPEFNFSGNINPRPSPQNLPPLRAASRPVDQIRELIHKYGQTEPSTGDSSRLGSRGSNVGLGIEPWNDDDDDIPEWNPTAPYQQQQQRFHHPLQPTYGSQTSVPTVLQQQLNPVMVPPQSPTWHQGGRWAQPPVNPGNEPGGRQHYRMPGRRQDSSRSRGY